MPELALDHVAVTVPDLDAAVDWYAKTFGFSLAWSEDWTDAPAQPLGLSGDTVRLRGAGLDTGGGGGVYLELHEIPPPRPTTRTLAQTGISHFAFRTDDLDALYARLVAAGVSFKSFPKHIESGGLAGERWVHAEDPWGVTWHLCQHPSRPPFAHPSDDASAAMTVDCSTPIGIGMLGNGFMARAHTKALQDAALLTLGSDSIALVSLCRRDEAKLATMARQYGYVRHTTDWRSLVSDPDIAVIHNVAPNELHYEPTLAALQAGKPCAKSR
jgi:catechol 2,3-dioxygenase-like lactoylglutathione lyase family enzyme